MPAQWQTATPAPRGCAGNPPSAKRPLVGATGIKAIPPIPQVTFEFYDKLKAVVARFDQAQASTDGGVVLLKAVDDRLHLTDQLVSCLVDRRDPEKIRHSVRDLLRQWLFGLACGYEDGNDAAWLADDPLHKLAVGGIR